MVKNLGPLFFFSSTLDLQKNSWTKSRSYSIANLSAYFKAQSSSRMEKTCPSQGTFEVLRNVVPH